MSRVLMKYFPGAARAGFEFARPSLGYQQGKDGDWHQVAADQLCDEHYMTDPTTGKLVRTLLLEPDGGTNRLRNPGFEDEPLGAWWTKSSSIVFGSDPAQAYSGRGYVAITSPAATTRSCFALDAPNGDHRLWPVQPGDRCAFGGMIARDSGDGYGRILCTPYDADRNAITSAVSTMVRVAEWTLSAGSYLVPAGVAYVGARCYVNADGVEPTSARFDDAYLRILRAGVVNRAADSLTWDPIG